MATNRFQGVIATNPARNEAFFNGIYAGYLADIDLRGELSEAGAGTDVGANEDYSSTATYFAYIATSDCVINRVVLALEAGTVDETAAADMKLFVGGLSALTNGIDFQVRDTDDTVLLSYDVVKTIDDFIVELGADVFRSLSVANATNTVNHDSVVVTLDFTKIFGHGIRLRNTDKIGFYLNDDLSGLTNVEGSVFGRKIFIGS